MKWLLTVIVTLIVAVLLTRLAMEDTGYAMLAYGDTTVESSLSLLVSVLVAGFIAFYAALRLLSGTWRLPRNMARWNRERRWLRARQYTRRGLIALAEGRWERAEKELIRHVEDFDAPLLNYLGAARAAQKLGADERRDDYLARAAKSMPDAKLAVGLTQAEVQLSQGQYEQALASLIHLRSLAPKHTHVLYLLKRLYERLESWDDLLALLPDLRKHKVLEPGEVDQLEQKAYQAQLARTAKSRDATRLATAWEAAPKGVRHNPEMVGYYVDLCLELGTGAGLEPLVRETLRRQWDDHLVRVYGLLESDDPNRQLQAAEDWLKQYPHHADLLLTLGRLCLRSQLWGKARSYLEASLGVTEQAVTYCELGNLLAQLGETDKATDCYRKGLTSAVGGECTRFSVEGSAR